MLCIRCLINEIEQIINFFESTDLVGQKQTELYGRDDVRNSTRISNPGCYATSAQLILAPLVKNGLIHASSISSPSLSTALPTIFGISGYSGAGTVPGSPDSAGRPTTLPKVTPEALAGGLKPYSLTDHIHEREAGRHLTKLLQSSSSPSDAHVKVAFVPTVAPWFSGIMMILSAPLTRNVNARDVKAMYEEMYSGEKLVKIKADVPLLGDIEGKHGWTVGGFQVHSEGGRVVVVVSCVWFDLS